MINSILTKVGIIVFVILGFTHCKNYYIPIDSFTSQFSGIDSLKLSIVNTRYPTGNIVQYYANQVDYIKCFDKNNNAYELKNSPSIEIRITEKNNKRTIFYFDSIYLQDSLIIGDKSRFLGLKKEISINNIKLIEVQDGKKNFKYIEKKQ